MLTLAWLQGSANAGAITACKHLSVLCVNDHLNSTSDHTGVVGSHDTDRLSTHQ